MPRNFEDTNSSLYREAVAAGYRFREKNDGEGGSYMQLVGIDPPKTDYAPPRQRAIVQVGPPPEKKKEEKKKPEPQPQKLPDPVVDGREIIKDFNENYGKIWQQPEDTKYKGPEIFNPGAAVTMAENAWQSIGKEDEPYKKAKEKSQAYADSSRDHYQMIHGEDVTARVMEQNQQMTSDFKKNWQDYLNPVHDWTNTPQGI